MLTGQAKTEYMRDYMRRKRAGLVTRKERQPSQGMIGHIRYWINLRAHRSYALRDTAKAVLNGLTFKNYEEDMAEACRRLKAIRDQQKQDRKEGKSRRYRSRPPVWFCRVCGDAKWDGSGKLFIGDDEDNCLCEKCIDKATKLLAKTRAKRRLRPKRK